MKKNKKNEENSIKNQDNDVTEITASENTENAKVEEIAASEKTENAKVEEIAENTAEVKSQEETPDVESQEATSDVKTPDEPTKQKTKRTRLTLTESFAKLQDSIPALIVVFAASIIIMGMSCLGIFFFYVKGPEQVLVPNVVGKKWDEALLEMQVKELYPRINLRYSNVPGDEGLILEQEPEAGAIVKGYSRVSLVISRGVVVDEIGSYVGKNIDEVQMSLQTLFAGQQKPLIVLATPEYKPDLSEPGTILEQDPPEGFKISEPVTVQLVVSRGPNYENTRRPYVIGQSINDLLQTIARSKIVFDITSHDATDDEKPGTVTNQQQIETEYVPNYTRVTVEMAMPKSTANDDNVYGIYQVKLPEYPYPVPMKLEAIPSEGDGYTILNFNHPGGNLTIPYIVPRGTTLVLSIVDKVNSRKLVE
ncbi:MAG: PASTA domain-containing protein [Treponema sp.]|nr:PASTA domain-containing protein [Treponema sp.]